MSLERKYLITQIGFYGFIPVALYAIGQVQSYGMSGDMPMTIKWLVILCVCVLVSAICRILMKVYRDAISNQYDKVLVQTETIAKSTKDDQ